MSHRFEYTKVDRINDDIKIAVKNVRLWHHNLQRLIAEQIPVGSIIKASDELHPDGVIGQLLEVKETGFIVMQSEKGFRFIAHIYSVELASLPEPGAREEVSND